MEASRLGDLDTIQPLAGQIDNGFTLALGLCADCGEWRGWRASGRDIHNALAVLQRSPQVKGRNQEVCSVASHRWIIIDAMKKGREGTVLVWRVTRTPIIKI